MKKWTLSKMIENLRDRIDEDTQDYVSDTELKDYINSGIYNIGLELELEDIYKTDLTNATTLDLPTDLLAINTLFIDGRKLNIVPIEEKSNHSEGYYVWGDKISFLKPQNGKMELFYLKYPALLDLPTDTTEIPPQYQTLPIIYAMSKVKEKDEEMGLAMALLDQFNTMKYEMITEIKGKKQSSQITFVNSSFDTDSGGW